MVPAIVFLAVPVMFVHVSVCEVDLCPWYELVVRVCVEGVGAVKAAAGLGYSR